jgi:hypothetical protein
MKAKKIARKRENKFLDREKALQNEEIEPLNERLESSTAITVML